MIFLLLFALGALAVPLAWDMSKNPHNNILQRSGRDLLEYSAVQTSFRSIHIATERANTAVLGIISLAVFFVLAYLVLKALSILGQIASVFIGLL